MDKEEDSVGSGDEDTTRGSRNQDKKALPTLRPEDIHFSTNELYGITKGKTIYVYKNEEYLNNCLASLKPIAGIVDISEVDGQASFDFSVVFRKPVKLFAMRKVNFLDGEGLSYHGLWCTKIQVEVEESVATDDFEKIQSSCKLSAVALPLWYLVGKNQPNSDKYCVITNWWKYRMSDGTYRLPLLDRKLYDAALEEVDVNTFLEEASRGPASAGVKGATHGVI